MIDRWRIIVGDCLEVLAGLPEASVHCCVTSPPYWGLRDYGVGGQLGLEPTPEAFIEKMVEVFRGVRRIMRDDATLWLNMGDSYASGQGGRQSAIGESPKTPIRTAPAPKSRDDVDVMGWSERAVSPSNSLPASTGLKPKDLIGMPWRLALALQADGWWLRSAMPWVKRSAMPESCTDRPASALEYVFLLTKKPRYYWDAEAVRQKAEYGRREVDGFRSVSEAGRRMTIGTTRGADPSAGRAYRNTDLWFQSIKPPHGLTGVGDELVGLDVNPEAFRDAHFATFPQRLVEPCIMAGTSDKGCCPECGSPWRRVVETEKLKRERPNDKTERHAQGNGVNACGNTVAGVSVRTIGWEPGCGCVQYADESTDPVGAMAQSMRKLHNGPIPATVLDPFAGSGTTLLVARKLGRDGIGIELSEDYAAMARKRIANPAADAPIPDVPGQLTMFGGEE